MNLILDPGEYYGKVVKATETSAMTLSEVTYRSGLSTPKHCHKQAMVVVSLEGLSTQLYGNKPTVCKPWSVSFHPPEEVHWDHFYAPGVRDLNIEIAPDKLSTFRDYSSAFDRPFTSMGWEPRQIAAKLYREFREFDELSPLAIEGLLIELLVEASRRQASRHSAPPIWLRQAREILRAQFAQSMTLTDLAQSVGVHPVHLAREFHRFFCRTVGQELRQLRIECACREILESKKTLGEIALIAGFSDQSHFTRTFKRMTGMTPIQFRLARQPSKMSLSDVSHIRNRWSADHDV
ncbi:AraC family transcriptional regulator [Granulicella sp. S156]|uniref:helix-turn-helix domain-containing protein n=1 Tax=Granulicella sp. S156 TaxID=1747224 RepID=UPI00131BC4E7|nr:AraC family transcriptional regulator [Granulicella sp. S156]